jgi:hypothetical protein
MARRATRKSTFDQANLFDPPDQADLFGEAQPRFDVYVPKQEHVRNSLIDLLEKFRALERWDAIRAWQRRDLLNAPPYYCKLITNKDEAAEWRRLLETEIARLDALGSRRPQEERSEYLKYPESFEIFWSRSKD